MNKKNLFQLVGLAAALTVGAVELPLTNPPAPFVKKTNVKQEKTKPVFDAKGNRIIFGSKVLQFFPSGFVSITDAGKPLGNFYFYGNTPFSPWMTNQNIQAKPPQNCARGLGIDSFTADEKTRSFTVKGKIPCHKKGEPELLGDYEFKATLLSSNKVRFHMEYTIPETAKRGRITMMCNFTNAQKYRTPKKESGFPVKRGEQHMYWKPAFLRVFAAGGIAVGELKPLTDITLYTRPSGLVAVQYNTSKKTPKHVIGEFELDLITWSGNPSTGAVNLREVDALDPEEPASRNLMQNPYFAQGLNHVGYYHLLYPHRGFETIKLSQDNPKFGENCLMAGNSNLTIQVPAISAEPGTYTYSWYARTDAEKGGSTSIYVSNHAYSYVLKQKSFRVGKEWKRYQVTAKVPGVVGMRAQISVSANGNAPYKVYLDGLQLEKGNKATAFDCSPVTGCLMTSAKGDFIRHGDKIGGKLRLSTLKDNVSGKLNVSVQDMFGTELYKTSSKFAFGKKEHPVIPLALDGRIPDGVFKVKVDFDVNGKKYTEYFRFSVMPFFANKHKIKNLFAQSYNGGSNYIDVYPGLEEYIRRSMLYGSGSDTHNPYPTKAYDKLAAKYNYELIDSGIGGRTWENGIKKLFPEAKPLPGHTYYRFWWMDTRKQFWAGKGGLLVDHRLCGGWTPEYRKKVVNTVEYIVRKSSPRRVYEIGSEWADELKNDPHYIDLVLAVREGVKNVYPNALFCEAGSYNMDVGGGVREIDSTLTRLKGKMPIEVIHSHTYTMNILNFEPNFKALVDTVENKHGYKNVKYYFGEGMHYGPYDVPAWGLQSASWDGVHCWCTASTISYDVGWTEKKSAAYFMRSWLICLTKINQVIAATSAATNASAVFLDVEMHPRLYQKVPNTLSVFLGNAKRFVKDVSFAQHTKCLIWEDEKNRPVAVVWYQDPLADQGLKQGPWATAKLPGDVEIYDMMGVKRTTPKDGRFPVSIFPFFFRGKPGQVDAFVKLFANAEIVGDTSSPFRTNLDITSRTEATLTLENFKARPVSGIVKSGGKTTNVKLAPLAKTQVRASLTPAIPYDRLAEVSTKYSVTTNGKTTETSDSFVGLAVKRFTGDWNRIPSFAITNFDGNRKKGSDFSAKAQLAWDKNNFYIRVTVTDDKFVHTEHPAAGNRWENDSLQIFIDTRCSARKKNIRTFDEDDYAYTFIFDKGKPKLFRWRSPDIQLTFGVTAPKDMTIAEDIPCKFTKTKIGYIYETAIPSGYMLPARMENNYAFGFALYVNDRDDGKKVKQSLTMTPAGTSPFNSPYLYPIVLLTDK